MCPHYEWWESWKKSSLSLTEIIFVIAVSKFEIDLSKSQRKISCSVIASLQQWGKAIQSIVESYHSDFSETYRVIFQGNYRCFRITSKIAAALPKLLTWVRFPSPAPSNFSYDFDDIPWGIASAISSMKAAREWLLWWFSWMRYSMRPEVFSPRKHHRLRARESMLGLELPLFRVRYCSPSSPFVVVPQKT